MKTDMRSMMVFLLAVAVLQSNPPYSQIFYNNGKLRLETYLYKPAGDGPFPLVVLE